MFSFEICPQNFWKIDLNLNYSKPPTIYSIQTKYRDYDDIKFVILHRYFNGSMNIKINQISL